MACYIVQSSFQSLETLFEPLTRTYRLRPPGGGGNRGIAPVPVPLPVPVEPLEAPPAAPLLLEEVFPPGIVILNV